MNILLTGSNGFIGNHVAQYLKSKGHYVIGLGRNSEPFDTRNIDEYIQQDLGWGGYSSLDLPLKTKKIDAVIHLAADMRKEPYCAEVVGANCVGTQRLLEMCENYKIGIFLQLSSLPVIGHPEYHPITEEHPIHPYTVYHITKRTEELLANYAYEYHGVRTASYRISAPIGPRVNPKTIFPTFVRKALNNEPLSLLGKGSRCQNYVYVKDIARCLELSLLNENVHGVYNLTSNLLISNLDLAKTIIKVLQSDSVIELHDEDPADGYVWDASLDRISHDSGYNPNTRIEDVILEYAEWLRGQS